MKNRFTILGQPYSKANRRRVTKTGAWIKSKEAMAYAKNAKAQLQNLKALGKLELLEGDVMVVIEIWYRTRLSDLDESLILDVLQGFCYENDRQVRRKVVHGYIDKEHPRAQIIVEAL